MVLGFLMADEMTNAAETAASSEASGVEIRDTPNADGMIPASDVAGLKSALEKLKNELKELKPKAGLFDQLASDGIDPSELPTKIAQLKEQQAAAEQIAQLKAELESRYRGEREQAEQAYQAQLKTLSTYLQGQSRDTSLTEVFIAGGGKAQSKLEAQQFKTLVNNFVEWEDSPVRDESGAVIAYESKIKKFRDPEGQTLFVEDNKSGQVKEANMPDFLNEIKKGRYGAALQYMLPAYNQSSGSGIAGGGGVAGTGRLVLRRSQLANLGELTPAQIKAVRKGDYDLID
jgi:hypothetical protein